MKQTLAITRKELEGYFGSPMALIFVGAFLAATLFSFFWVDTFFARGIADVRPLFRWMPVLMIFLVAALTMRQWSEEQRSGTLEVLLTLPVSPIQLVAGKFLAVMALVAVALALTIFLPITVSLLGNLDWGPVFGGYLAAILLAAAYVAIGLFVSSRTDNQIVALILTVLLGGLFYLAGSGGVTDFVGDRLGEILRAIGSGSRFESIQRGVVDLRDLLYYLSLTGVFLALNVASLNSKRWSTGKRTLPYRRSVVLTTVLVVLNLVLLNVWVFPLHARGLRLDLTAQQEYSLSQTTRDLLDNLQEPLLIRGYFSEKTHPLLAPLVPRIRDMLQEYKVASGGMVQLEIIDPAKDPDKEAEANQTYGIRPTPFQVAGRYETSIINSYFDILIRYGDQNVVLNFRDLIEIEPRRDGNVDVRLRNLEYDLTSSIKKVIYGFQSVDAVLAALDTPAELTVYLTPDTLPEWLADVPETIEKVAQDIASESNDKFTYTVVDPDAPDSPTTRQELYERYGLQPFAVSLFSSESYYLHMILQVGDQARVIYPSGELSEADVRTAIESALKRASPGFLQVVGLWTPPAQPTQDMFGQMQPPLSSWQELSQSLRQEYEVRTVDLSTGQVPADVDVLVVVAPQGMTDKERFAIDQYLMRGGSVVVAGGNYGITADQFGGGLALKPLEDGLREMLSSYGIQVEESLVMDPQNEPFPVPVTRQVGAFQVQEIQAIDYPFFVDVRPDGMASDSPIISNLPAVTLNWASPITIDDEKNADRQVTTLLQSSPASWTQTDTNIQPDFDLYPDLGFPVGGEPKSHALAVSIQGVFESYFKDKPSPFAEGAGESEEGEGEEAEAEAETAQEPIPGTIEVSPETARLVVIGSAEFVDDIVFEISSRLTMDRYLSSVRLMQNAVAWSTEDLDLLDIRSRGTYARVLDPMTESEQSFWEGANYVVALVALIVIGILWNARRKNEQPIELLPPKAIPTSERWNNETA
ncbi:MAG: ABC transporter permease subunit [Anaerolineae bacterium]|nr:ABC transporter permease subunit [Anaerolineae bacterium]